MIVLRATAPGVFAKKGEHPIGTNPGDVFAG